MMAAKSFVFRFGDVEVREREFTLIKAGAILPVEPKAFRVLLLLLRNPQKLIAKEELLSAVWGDAAVTENSLTRSIALLRKLLGDDTRNPRYIETVATVGYRFVCKVEVSEEASGTLDPTGLPPANGSLDGASAAAEMETDLKRRARDLDPELVSGNSVSVATTDVRPGRRRVAMFAGAAGLVLLLAVAYVLRPTVPPPRVIAIKQITRDGKRKMYSEGYRVQNSMVTDGLRVYFQVLASEGLQQVSTEGGESAPLRAPFDLGALIGLTPTKSDLLLLGPAENSTDPDEGGLWTMPVFGGQARRIGNIMAFDATWSPDGASIYYTAGPAIWVAKSDGSQARRILTSDGRPNWIRFSPDGRLFRFGVLDEKHNTSGLWEARTDGSGVRRLFSGDAWPNECCGDWTADGKYFVFESKRGGVWNLWAMREKRDWWRKSNREPVQLATGASTAESPLPSSDGKRIFYMAMTERGELERYDLQRKSIVPYLPGLSAEWLDFSRDGSRMAYVTLPEGNLWTSEADGSDRRQLTFAAMKCNSPRWSPDRKQIVFIGIEPGKVSKMYIIPADGGNPEQLLEGEEAESDPSWSPNGDAVAFSVDYATAISSRQHPIQILNLKSHKLTALADSGGYFSARWSPDGRWIAAIDAISGVLELYDLTKQTWEELTKIQGGYESWSQNSQCIYFNHGPVTNADRAAEYRICLNDRKPQVVADLGGLGPTMSDFGGWSGLTPDGSILAVRDTSLEEIYSLELDLP
jgi:Tol biopolymer transport system component/DNA-binding winged helix-turn-helix (wHTH) protein